MEIQATVPDVIADLKQQQNALVSHALQHTSIKKMF